MTMLTRMRNWIAPPASAPAPAIAPRAALTGVTHTITNSAELEQFLTGRDGAGVVSQETAMRVAAVFASARIISGTVSTLPLSIKRRVDERTREDASGHALWRVLRRRPNRWMKPSAFRRLMQNRVLFKGNGYALKVTDSRGEVGELWPLDPDRTTPRQLDNMEIVYEYRRKDGATTVFPSRDIMHLMGMSHDGVTGVSVLSYARNAIALSIDTDAHGRAVFSNGARPGSSLETDNALSEDAIERLRQSLEEYRGAENAHKTMILEEGLKFKPIAMTMEDAQFIETRKFSRTDIAMFFGVPPHMIGDTEKSDGSGKNLEERSRAFVQYTLEDWLTAWEDAINTDLIDQARDPDLFARFNRNALVRGDMTARKMFYQAMLQFGVFSPNEVRAKEDENPRDGGDVYYPPPNMSKIPEGDGDEPA